MPAPTAHTFDNWRGLGEAALRACADHRGDARPLVVGAPATLHDVERVEAALALRLPDSFRRVLLQFSASFELTWFLPDEYVSPFEEIFSGCVSWSIGQVIALEEARRSWVEKVFPNEDDAYDRVWHHKLAVAEVGNGDMLALDLRRPNQPLTYLSHDDGKAHGYLLGSSFEDAIGKSLRLGGVGAEDWQWLPFVSGPESGLEPEGKNAKRWRDWFGLDRHLRAGDTPR